MTRSLSRALAATVLVLLGLDPQEFNPAAGPPIPLAFER